ncbi:MAG: hypothetical protein FWG87_11495 [Defluviitaleaceae bacterium]|nr:hypothetical protein [Defluviitaleaceae bacterium]
MNINSIGLESPYITNYDVLNTPTPDFSSQEETEKDEIEEELRIAHTTTDFDLENAVLKANSGSAVHQKMAQKLDVESIYTDNGSKLLDELFTKVNIPPPTFPASVFNLSLDELNTIMSYVYQLTGSLDTSGLSDADKYKMFDAIFSAYLGNDFLDAAVVNRATGCDYFKGGFDYLKSTQWAASSLFYETLVRHGIDSDNLAKTIKDANGFTGMSDDKIRAAVRAKYSEPMTYRDALLMAEELKNLGLLDVNIGDFIRGQVNDKAQQKLRTSEERERWLTDFYSRVFDATVDFDELVNAVKGNLPITIAGVALNPAPTGTMSSAGMAFNTINEDTTTARKKVAENMIRRMEEEMIATLTGQKQVDTRRFLSSLV